MYQTTKSLKEEEEEEGKKNPLISNRLQLLNKFKDETKNCLLNVFAQPSLKSRLTDEMLQSNQESFELEPINIRDLLVDTKHTGRVLVVRTIIKAYNADNTIHLLVEDQNADTYEPVDTSALLVTLHNYVLPGRLSIQLETSSIFHFGIILAIMEPLSKLNPDDGSLQVCVDDPRDVVPILTPNHPHLFNQTWREILVVEQPKSVEKWRLAGNEYYRKGNYELALGCYNSGLVGDPNNTVLSLNKMAALLELGNYHECIPLGLVLMARLPTQQKIPFRLGKAYYYLCLYERAIDFFNHFLSLSPTEPSQQNAQEFIKKCKVRIGERDHGKFNYKAIMEDFDKHQKETDCSEYIGPVKIIQTEKMGRGLAVTEDLKPGTLLIVSRQRSLTTKATKEDHDKHDILDEDILGEANLFNNHFDSPISKAISKLYSGPTGTDKPLPPTTLDDFKISEADLCKPYTHRGDDLCQRITKYNSFGDMGSGGILLLPSLINHSCVGNVATVFYGDTAFIFSTTNLKANQEIFINYVDRYLSYPKRMKALERYDITMCPCQLCELDRQETTQSFQQRDQLIDQFGTNKFFENVQNNRLNLVSETENIVTLLKATFKNKTRASILSYEMFQIIGFLPTACNKVYPRFPEKALQACLDSLATLGLSMDQSDLKRKLTPGEISYQAITIRMPCPRAPFIFDCIDIYHQLAHHCFQVGYIPFARKAMALARLCCVIHKQQSIQDQNNYFAQKQFYNQLLSFNDNLELI